MAFLAQETALASTIAGEVEGNVLGGRIRALSERNRIFTSFQSLTPKHNDLHEASTTYAEIAEVMPAGYAKVAAPWQRELPDIFEK